MAPYWLPVVRLHSTRANLSLTSATCDTKAADNAVKIWSPFTGQLIRNLNGHTKGLSDVAWSSDSVYLASASDDTTIRIWDVDSVCYHTTIINISLLIQSGCEGSYNKNAQRAHKFCILRELQYRVDVACLRWMRRGRQNMEFSERCEDK